MQKSKFHKGYLMHIESAPFRVRGFFTLLLLLSALVSGISGIALYLRPEGSLARWVGWTWVGLDKQHWEAVHTMFVFFSLIAALVHLWYNWKPLTSYIRSKAALIFPSGRRMPFIREFLAALAVTSLLWYAAVGQWQPLSLLIDLRTQIKNGEYAMSVPPPSPDADKMSLSELCKTMGISEQTAMDRARAHGIVANDVSMTVGALARQHSLSPEELYLRIK
jgi:hypothetical protein